MIKEITLENLGTVNKNCVSIDTDTGCFDLYFSYETLVGVSYPGNKATIQNYWSTTTGKLLNELEPDKSKRLNRDDFQKEINYVLGAINVMSLN